MYCSNSILEFKYLYEIANDVIEELEKDLEECLTNYLFHLKPFVVEKYYYLQAMVKNGL